MQRARAEEGRAKRGRLRIFLGMAPGVGKTFAMLSAAHRFAHEGVDVVIGVVETHRRAETERLLLGLDILPRRTVEYRGTELEEFDLDAAILRRPEILVVDELAHSNVPGSRFAKRWQDVRAVLDAGIDVFTTLNVQHIESLNDVVRQITGVEVRETVPDDVVEDAAEVELVDLPPDALIERLRQGKVYIPESAQAARESFFRRENLAALRELALRKTAEFVDANMAELRSERGIQTPWPAADRVLVAVSPSPLSPTLVRAARRIAAGLRAPLVAAYVETPASARLSAADRERVQQTLALAERLGAETVVLSGTNAATELVGYARTRNVSRIVVGKTARSRWQEILFGSFVQEVIRRSGDIDVHVVRGEAGETGPSRASAAAPQAATDRLAQIAIAVATVAACTLLGKVLLGRLDDTNVAMVYLAGVVFVSSFGHRFAASLAAILGVAAFDFFFIPPHLTFAVSDTQYLLTFGVMLAVGLLVANLAATLRSLADEARERAARVGELYTMARGLAAARDRDDVGKLGVGRVRDSFAADAVLLVSTPDGGLASLASAGVPDWLDEREMAVARWSRDHAAPAGVGTTSLPSAAGRHVPLVATRGTMGVISVRPAERPTLEETPAQTLLAAFADQIAMALERVELLEASQTARLEAARERTRSALLSSVSHDLRTPLASIAGAASTVLESGDSLDAGTRAELLRGIAEESDRLADLVAELVFATRLESGGVDPRREWSSVQEIVGSGLARLAEALGKRPFKTIVPGDLPLVRVDPVMMSQVVHNLVDNALRHTPDGTAIEVSAWVTDDSTMIQVRDHGPGLGPGDAPRVFDRFYRGKASGEGRPGLGLGLTVCRGIVEAHGGRIWAENAAGGGAAFTVSLPREHEQPALPSESDG